MKHPKIIVVNLGETMDRLGRHRLAELHYFVEQAGMEQAIKAFRFDGSEKAGPGEAFVKYMKKHGFAETRARHLNPNY